MKRLALGKNMIKVLPGFVADLPSLEWLDLTENPLERIEDLACLSLHLAGLGLGACRLIELPESLGRMSRLRKLSLFRNSLTTLPASIQSLRQVTRLDLSDNQLTTLPDEVHSKHFY